MVRNQIKIIILLLISILVYITSVQTIEFIKNRNVGLTNNYIKQRISDGSNKDKIFLQYFAQNPDSKKFQQLKISRKFKEARDKFKQEGSDFCADPEVLIYLNNQKIIGESYTIAVPVPIEDPDINEKNFALEILRGVAQAQDEINNSDKKINGKPLRILIVNDDYNNTSLTNEIANYLVNDKKILGIVGHGTSTATKAATAIYSKAELKENRLVSISPSSTSTNINPNATNEYFFRTIPSNKIQAQILTRYILKNIPIPNAAIIWNSKNDDYSESFKKEFESSFKQGIDGKKGKIPLSYDIETKFQDNIKKILQEATDKKVNVFVLTGNIGTLKETFSQITSRQDSQKFYYVGGDAVYGRNILQKAFRNMVVTITWHKSNNSEKSVKFTKTANTFWCQTKNDDNKEKINSYTAAAYDATKLFINALIDTSKNSIPNRQLIKENLEQYKLTDNTAGKKVSFQGITGNINFTLSGDTTVQSQLVRVCEIQPDEYVYKLEKLDNPNWDSNKCN